MEERKTRKWGKSESVERELGERAERERRGEQEAEREEERENVCNSTRLRVTEIYQTERRPERRV